jgi:hypothetical protein
MLKEKKGLKIKQNNIEISTKFYSMESILRLLGIEVNLKERCENKIC